MHKQSLFVLAFMFIIISQIVECRIVYLAEVFRHGARYPTNDIYDGKETKALHGELTGVGMRQQYNLGAYLKKDYIDELKLVNETLNPREVQVFTDSSKRCYYSAYAQLAGLFHLNTGEHIPQGIDSSFLMPPFEQPTSLLQQSYILEESQFALFKGYQPVPIKQSPAYFPKCKDQTKIIQKRVQDILVKTLEFQAEHLLFTQKIKSIFKLSLQYQNLAGLILLYDVVVCDMNLGRPMPSQFTEAEFRQLQFIQNYMFILLYDDKLARVQSTPIASGIISNMQKVISGKSDDKKMTLISAHDSNVAPMLSFFNLSSAECVKKRFKNESISGNCAQPVPFASNLIFELHENQNLIKTQEDKYDAASYYVKIRYNGDYYDLCQKTSKQCSYIEFSNRVKRSIVDFDHECGNNK